MRAVIKAAAILGTISAAMLLAPELSATGRQPDDQPSIVVDLTGKQLTLKLGDSVVQTYYIAIGQDGHPTPTGKFSIRTLTWNPRWVPPPDADWARKLTPKAPGHPANPMKVVKIFFKEPYYYIHGTGDAESIGTAASHGCLRMDPDEVTEVGKWVMAHGGAAQEENWFLRILHSRREEKVVYLSQPIPIEIEE
ncbi:MAG TPA: L,D-transpeptidase [Gemmatimonadaceae bacterium]|nr:L,D-transpeptidase [Gemmatimonadaceae bacterium]